MEIKSSNLQDKNSNWETSKFQSKIYMYNNKKKFWTFSSFQSKFSTPLKNRYRMVMSINSQVILFR